jgi:hypothetical protein
MRRDGNGAVRGRGPYPAHLPARRRRLAQPDRGEIVGLVARDGAEPVGHGGAPADRGSRRRLPLRQALRTLGAAATSLLGWTRCDDPPPTSTDCSIHDGSATSARRRAAPFGQIQPGDRGSRLFGRPSVVRRADLPLGLSSRAVVDHRDRDPRRASETATIVQAASELGRAGTRNAAEALAGPRRPSGECDRQPDGVLSAVHQRELK